ncbi:MAG TPA: Thivi_2564 family membrane protein [Bryobacteraceae bacterium]|nr:Thivi_2564 family membrane protein [Bryobacteraceae bacterium]
MPMAVTSAAALVLVALLLCLVNRYIPLESNMKRIVNIVLVLIVVGVVLWAINTYILMAGSIKAILNIVVVLGTCVGVLQAVGLWDEIKDLARNFTEYRIVRRHRIGHPHEPQA